MQRWYRIFHAPVPYLALTKFLLTTMQRCLKSFAIWIRPTWGNLDELVLRLEELSVLQTQFCFAGFVDFMYSALLDSEWNLQEV